MFVTMDEIEIVKSMVSEFKIDPKVVLNKTVGEDDKG